VRQQEIVPVFAQALHEGALLGSLDGGEDGGADHKVQQVESGKHAQPDVASPDGHNHAVIL